MVAASGPWLTPSAPAYLIRAARDKFMKKKQDLFSKCFCWFLLHSKYFILFYGLLEQVYVILRRIGKSKCFDFLGNKEFLLNLGHISYVLILYVRLCEELKCLAD